MEVSYVLVVAVTRFGKMYCVGAYDLTRRCPLRLCEDSTYRGLYNPLTVGGVYRIAYTKLPPLVGWDLSHSEDVLVNDVPDILDSLVVLNPYDLFLFIKEASLIDWQGFSDCLFDKRVHIRKSSASLYCTTTDGLIYSTGFWVPMTDLTRIIDEGGKIRYVCTHSIWYPNTRANFPYVGLEKDPVSTIPAQSIVRVSLTRISLDPGDGIGYYSVQLSGYYLEDLQLTSSGQFAEVLYSLPTINQFGLIPNSYACYLANLNGKDVIGLNCYEAKLIGYDNQYISVFSEVELEVGAKILIVRNHSAGTISALAIPVFTPLPHPSPQSPPSPAP